MKIDNTERHTARFEVKLRPSERAALEEIARSLDLTAGSVLRGAFRALLARHVSESATFAQVFKDPRR